MTVDRNEMKELLNEVLDERRTISEEKHVRHHDYLDYLEAKAKLKAERMEKIKTTVLGWFVITIIIGAGSVAWHGFVYFIKAAK